MNAWRRPLLAWYDRARRRLPWREHPTPYRVWISEIMLQQTQVATALPYYERFLSRFPDEAALAAASEEEVLKHWAGLGYYSRARNLREAARRIVSEHGGSFPRDPDAVLALPGIGRYTAGAILSIAFGQKEPLVDGNVARVFSRLFALKGDAKSQALLKKVWMLAADSVDSKRPGDYNQALMELGALICVPETPRCADCPISTHCEARKQGLEESLPERAQKRAPIDLAWKALWIEKSGRVLLWKRSGDERFLPGHWALPEARHLSHAKPGARLGIVRHTITHHRIKVELLASAAASPPPNTRWVPLDRTDELLVSSLWKKAVKTARAAAPKASETPR